LKLAFRGRLFNERFFDDEEDAQGFFKNERGSGTNHFGIWGEKKM
jgi:hypothetical protein